MNWLLLSSSAWRFCACPLKASPSWSTTVRSDCSGTDSVRVLTLVSMEVTGAGMLVSACRTVSPPTR